MRIGPEDRVRLVVGPVIPADIVGIERSAHIAREGQTVFCGDTGTFNGAVPQHARRVSIHTAKFHTHDMNVAAIAAAPCVKALRPEQVPVGIVGRIIVVDHLVPCAVILAADIGPQITPDPCLEVFGNERNGIFNCIHIVLAFLDGIRNCADIAPCVALAVVCAVIVPADGIRLVSGEGIDQILICDRRHFFQIFQIAGQIAAGDKRVFRQNIAHRAPDAVGHPSPAYLTCVTVRLGH